MAMSLNRLKSKRYSTGLRKKAARYTGDLYSPTDTWKLKKPTKEDTENVEKVKARLTGQVSTQPEDDRIRSVLMGKYANGDVDKAVDLLVLWDKTSIGIIESVDHDVRLLGAENNGKVTCYLDSLLFALYARLDSFEPMLCNEYNDESQKKLSALLRMFVNMLRTGRLITTDLMQQIQDCLAECGWTDAGKMEQQDVSEAFSFIAEKLEAPLLTLKMDIAHGGKETPDDDHKFINERLLNVALPTEPDSNGGVSLEQCLEDYFNNRVDVQRKLEQAQAMPLTPTSPMASGSMSSMFLDEKPMSSLHVEYTDLGSVPSSPASMTPSSFSPTIRERAPSILRSVSLSAGKTEVITGRRRRASTLNRKEITIPAWQFFSILPFYTDSTEKREKATTASTFANHFSSKRPTIGLCLKRYSWNLRNMPVRNGIDVRIPLEIDLPHFVDDEDMENPGRFRLVLQSAVCHRGTTTHSGHYVALIRGDVDQWLLFDDLAMDRIKTVNAQDAFAKESPYLLFYQVEMIPDDQLPAYEDESSVRSSFDTKHSQEATDGIPSFDIAEAESTSIELEPDHGATSPDVELTPDILHEVTAKLSHVSTEPITPTSHDSLRPASRGQQASLSAPGSKSGSRSQSKSAENRLSFGSLARLTTKRVSHDRDREGRSSDESTAAVDIPGHNSAGKEKKDKGKKRDKSRGRHKEDRDGAGDDKDCVIQ